MGDDRTMKTPGTDRWRYRREPRPFHPDDVGYHALAAGIVLQAVEDWKEAKKKLKKLSKIFVILDLPPAQRKLVLQFFINFTLSSNQFLFFIIKLFHYIIEIIRYFINRQYYFTFTIYTI